MYISYNWLKQYLPTLAELDIKEVSEKLSKSLAEVEQIIPKGQHLKKIVVGEIKEITDHPISDSLMIAQVDTKDKIRQVVFAKENKKFVKASTLFPVCLPGGQIYNPKEDLGTEDVLQIEAREFKGVLSEGFLCSPKELGVYDEPKGISIIGNFDVSIGEDLTNLLTDFILEIENKSLTHRPDCFSHRGIAREIAAIMQIEFLQKPEMSMPIKTSNLPFEVKIEKDSICRRFSAISATNVKVTQSPTWMQILLSYVGSRPINNIVDISNYVMLDIGYPIHIYDYDKLKKPKLIVRNAKNKEQFEGLNEKKYTLDETMVVVDDTSIIQDLAGILGGANSEISPGTKNVIIESASWDMYNIRRTAMKLGINTDAAMRFAKGIDAYGTLETVMRVSELICDLAGAEIASELVDKQIETFKPKIIHYKLNNIKRHLGIEIPKQSILQILNSLEIEIQQEENLPTDIWANNTTELSLDLVIPTFRRDLNIKEDITEELARIYGYEKITPSVPQRSLIAPKQNLESFYIRKFRSFLLQSGLDEIYTYTFIDKTTYDKCNLKYKDLIKLKNPLSSEIEYIRNSLLPSIMTKIVLNNNNFDDINLFEINTISQKNKKSKTELPTISKKIAIAVSKKHSQNEIFYTLKQKLDFLFSKLDLKISYQNLSKVNKAPTNTASIFHPNKSAVLFHKNEIIGLAGVINPQIKENFDLNNNEIAVAEIELSKLISILKTQQDPKYEPITTMQKSQRDLSFWIKQRDEVQMIIDSLNDQKFKNLEDINLIDFYQTEDKKSITLSFTLQNPKKTLTEEDINDTMKKVKNFIVQELDYEFKQ